MTRWHEPIEEKIKRMVVILENGCWDASGTGAWDHKGHRRIWYEGRHQLLHRLSYEVFVGPVPDGMDVGHKCHDEAALAGLCDGTNDCPHRRCVNLDHLKAEPRRDNLLASPLTQCSINKAKTECKRGHPFDEENTRIRKDGNRSCKTCDRMTKEDRKKWEIEHAEQGEE